MILYKPMTGVSRNGESVGKGDSLIWEELRKWEVAKACEGTDMFSELD